MPSCSAKCFAMACRASPSRIGAMWTPWPCYRPPRDMAVRSYNASPIASWQRRAVRIELLWGCRGRFPAVPRHIVIPPGVVDCPSGSRRLRQPARGDGRRISRSRFAHAVSSGAFCTRARLAFEPGADSCSDGGSSMRTKKGMARMMQASYCFLVGTGLNVCVMVAALWTKNAPKGQVYAKPSGRGRGAGGQ